MPWPGTAALQAHGPKAFGAFLGAVVDAPEEVSDPSFLQDVVLGGGQLAPNNVADPVKIMPVPGVRQPPPVSASLRTQEHLDGAALVHGLVPLGRLVQRQFEIEHLSRVDLAPEDEVD